MSDMEYPKYVRDGFICVAVGFYNCYGVGEAQIWEETVPAEAGTFILTKKLSPLSKMPIDHRRHADPKTRVLTIYYVT